MLVVFDLDGTLVDSLDDIAAAANGALEASGLSAYPTTQYREFVGWGLRRLLELAAPGASEALLGELTDGFRARYGSGRTRVYPGMRELCAELAGRGDALAVLSNKPDRFTKMVVDAHLAEVGWIAVLGQRDDVPRKPDPAGLIEICQTARVDPRDAVMVGDTDVDLETARAAGARGIGVTWGFGRLTDGVASTEQLRAALVG